MRVNHLNLADEAGEVYCEKVGQVVPMNDGFMSEQCSDCQYFNGHMQGEGVECLYEDGSTKDPFIYIDDPIAFAAKRQKARGNRR